MRWLPMAMQRGIDAYFFLNDDTVLYEDAVRRLIDCAVSDKSLGNPPIVVGSTRSSITGKQSYGGFTMEEGGTESASSLSLPSSFPRNSMRYDERKFCLDPCRDRRGHW